MLVYRIVHTIERFLPLGKDKIERYFSDLIIANSVFESLSSGLNYDNDEWISLDAIEIANNDGEYIVQETSSLRYLSDDTKIGVNFKIEG